MSQPHKVFHFSPEDNLPYGDLFVKAESKEKAIFCFMEHIRKAIAPLVEEVNEHDYPDFLLEPNKVVEEH